MRPVTTFGCLIALASLGTAIPVASAETVEAGPGDDIEAMINGLGPGDELVLGDGMYTLDSRFSFDIAGTAEAPIVIRGAEGASPHLHRPNARQNIIDIENAVHVVLRGIEFSGGSAGIRISGARFLTIDSCEIHDTADVALRVNDTGSSYEALHIVDNHIHHTNGTGEGMYLGCNQNRCQLFDSIIERNYVHHTDQDTVSQGDGIELKEGSYNNIIRDNVIHDTNFPCILTYSTVGNGAANIIERNVMWACGNHAIQSAADATIRNNIILSANVDGIAMQPHQNGTPSNLRVLHNTIVMPTNNAISLRGATGSVLIANNALYAQTGLAINVPNGDLSGLTVAGNIGSGGVAGTTATGLDSGSLATDFVSAHYDGAPPIGLFPAMGGALVTAGDATHVVADDFNGTPREEADVGAYAYDASGNPGWTLEAGFKELSPGSTPLPDGGVLADAGTPPARDGGSPPDGGMSGTDDPDASRRTDGGTSPGDGDGGGCSVHAPGTTAPLGALVLAVGLQWVRRRRRVSRRCRSGSAHS
jgi:hypothetical protein